MPATNYTPIQLYRSTTSGNLPLAANLSPGELALNIADNDMTMYMENASGVVKSFFNNPAALKYPTADGTSGHVLKTDGAGVLSFGAAPVTNTALTNNTRQAVTSSATTTIDLNNGNVIDLTMAANITTLSFTNVPASGTPILVQIIAKSDSGGVYYGIDWPNSIYWNAQGAGQVQQPPGLAQGASSVTVIALLTTDGGTKWRGWVEASIPGGAPQTLFASGAISVFGPSTRSSPSQISSSNNWVVLSGAGSTQGALLCINALGQLFGWNNASGSAGFGSSSSPIQIGTLTNWANAWADSYMFFATDAKGSLFAWGTNTNGRLGDGTTINRSSPVQIGTNTWVSIAPASAYSFCLGLDTSGKLWSWGANTNGQLGQNDTVARSSPTQVGALTTWVKIASNRRAGAAINASGQLFTWGGQQQGALGQNDAIARSSPTQVGALTTWKNVFGGAGNYSFWATTTSNALFAWGGTNQYGGLGIGTAGIGASVSSPTQVGALTTWYEVSASFDSTIATTTSGTLFSWGTNDSGQLGLGNVVNRSSPNQVGALTTWGQIKMMSSVMVATIKGTAVTPA